MWPILLQWGPVSIYSYGVLYLLGFILSYWIFRDRLRRQGFSTSDVSFLYGVAVAAGLIGARGLHVFVTPRPTWVEVRLGQVLQSGGMYYGGLLLGFATLVTIAYLRYRRVRPVLDAVAPALASGHALGRLGCLAAGCCWGRPTDLPWGVAFTHPLAQAANGTPLRVRLHPVQVYEALLEGGLAFLLFRWGRKPGLGVGWLWGLYLIGYGAIRMGMERLRGVPKPVVWGSWSVNDLISVGLMGAGLLFLGYARWSWPKAARKVPKG
ncbi:MAG: prolipoprotein diacylglyceryl transferase [Acidobacteria bacterium]|nr:prolipoprotein diacylglyceryl transferase [Acidobacteriota bacterium]MDW7983530.1 prolipoprotein diacylglyceryl transferase [Acidobacteriota bacterium]